MGKWGMKQSLSRKTLILAILLVFNLVMMSMLTIATDYTLGDTLRTYYSFDNSSISGSTISDSTGFSDATNSGATTGAVGFNVDAVTLASTDTITTTTLLPDAENFSLSMWLYFTGFDYDFIINQYEGSDANRFHFGLDHTTGNKFEFGKGGTLYTGSTTLNANSWYHVVVTRDGTNYSIYVNNTYDSSHTIAGTITESQLTRIGAESGNSNSFTGTIDEFAFFNNTVLNTTQISQLYNSGIGSFYPFQSSSDSSVTLLTPSDGTTYSSVTSLEYNVSESMANCSLWGNWSGTWQVNHTDYGISPAANPLGFSIDSLPEGSYVWNVQCNGTSWATYNNSFTVDTTNPSITGKPELTNNQTIVWNNSLDTYINFTDTNLLYSVKVNMSNGTIISNLSGLDTTFYQLNISHYIPSSITDETIESTVCDANASNCVSSIFYYTNLNPVVGYSSVVSATQQTNITLNLTNGTTVQSLNATLYYNNTGHYVGGDLNFTQNVTAPTHSTLNQYSVPFYWSIFVNDVQYNLTTYQQTVSNFYLDNCSTATNLSRTFYLRDELNQSLIHGNIDGTFYYDIGTGITKTFSLDLTNQNNFTICIYPGSESFNVDYSLDFSATDYPEKTLTVNDTIFTNVSSTTNLYLLKSSDGVYARFKVLDSNSNPLSNVLATMQGTVNGNTVTLEQEYTDGAGVVTFFADPDSTYTFTFTKTGYSSYSTTLKPTDSDIYTVTLTATTQTYPDSLAIGLLSRFIPIFQELTYNTIYDFGFELLSEYYILTACNLTLYDDNGNALISSAGIMNSSYCNLSVSYNVSNYQSVTSNVWYTVNGTTRVDEIQYPITNWSAGEYSMATIIDDITNFTGAGFNQSTKLLLSFIIIFGIVGMAAYKFNSVINPESILLLQWALVFFFSLIGWMTITAISFKVIAFNTVDLAQYAIFILDTMMTAGYLIWRHG